MTDEVRRDVVKIGLDFRAIPVDVGDGIEWEFHPDPTPQMWSVLVNALKKFTKFEEDDFGGDAFKEALAGFTEAMSKMLVKTKQQNEWIKKGYGLGPQQAISEALMGIWTGFPTTQQSSSGKASKRTGSASSSAPPHRDSSWTVTGMVRRRICGRRRGRRTAWTPASTPSTVPQARWATGI